MTYEEKVSAKEATLNNLTNIELCKELNVILGTHEDEYFMRDKRVWKRTYKRYLDTDITEETGAKPVDSEEIHFAAEVFVNPANLW